MLSKPIGFLIYYMCFLVEACLASASNVSKLLEQKGGGGLPVFGKSTAVECSKDR